MSGYLRPAVYVWTFATPYWQLWAVLRLRRWARHRKGVTA